jgi:hypothetical protein
MSSKKYLTTVVLRIIILTMLSWLLTAVNSKQQLSNSQSQAEYDFGQAIHFSLMVQSDELISAVTLFYNSADIPLTKSISVPVEPDTEVEASYSVDLTQLRLAPFTTVTYWWQVTDIAGTVVDVAAQSFIYEDDRFDWQRLTQQNVTVHWTNDDTGTGQIVIDIINDTSPRLATILPVELPNPLNVYVYPSAADLQASLRLTGRNWVGGHTNPELGVILVTAANMRTAAIDLRQSIPHELTHLVLYQITGTTYETLPGWLDEGLAAVMEGTFDPNEQFILEEAIVGGTTIPFSRLCAEFPVDGRQALLAYAQSASLVRYIQAEYGNNLLSQMVLAHADGADCDSMVSRTLNISLAQLNENWLRSINPRPSLVTFLQNNLIWLLLLVTGFIMMLFFLLPLRKVEV